MHLDLRPSGKLTSEHARLISSLEPSVRSEYNDFIGNIASTNKVSGLSWLLRVTCRNTHISTLLSYMCRIRLLENVLLSGDLVESVTVDSYSMKRICTKVLNGDTKVKITLKERHHIHVVTNFIRSIYLIVNQFLWPKLIRGKKIPAVPIIFLDTFLFVDSFDNSGKYYDRYFTGIQEHFVDRNKIWYVPTLIGLRYPWQYIKVFKSIRSSSEQFLMKEDWLTITDYIKALWFSLQLPEAIKKVPLWNGYDIKDLVCYELKQDRLSTSLLVPILTYLFIKRIKKLNVSLELVVDWSENQVIDRALVLATRKFYPDIYIKGYQGYVVPDYYACKDPTGYEIEAGTVPDEICVIGKKLINSKKIYSPSLKVNTAPAFRFSEIYNTIGLSKTVSNKVLVILPISHSESKEILDLCYLFSKKVGSKYKLVIKQHPSYTKKQTKKIFPVMNESCFNFMEGTLHQNLLSTNLLISMSSSVCYESILMEVPVAIIGSRCGPVMNPLSGLLDLSGYKVCYDANDILGLLGNEMKYDGVDLVDYVEPVTDDSVSMFLEAK